MFKAKRTVLPDPPKDGSTIIYKGVPIQNHNGSYFVFSPWGRMVANLGDSWKEAVNVAESQASRLSRHLALASKRPRNASQKAAEARPALGPVLP